MATRLGNLSKARQKELRDGIFYLNTAELHSFCDRHLIPYKILIETESGDLRSTQDKDRKKIVIKRVTHFLKTGKILSPTVFEKAVVRLSGLPKTFDENDRLYYGCYEKKNPMMIALLEELTAGEYRNGAISRILCHEFWTNGKAPTFKEYAKAWLKARDEYSLDQHPEAAYLTDLRKGTAGSDWKKIRNRKVKRVLRILQSF